MLPVLIKIGPVTLYTYGLMMALAMLTAAYYVQRRAGIEGEDPEKALDLAFYCLIAALVGSRALYIIVEYKQYIADPLAIFKIWEGGLVFYGGFIAAALTGFWFVNKHKIKPWKMADIAAPALALGHGIGRLGCLFAGCCYGKPTDSWLGITFTNPLALAPKGIPLYPTQIFSSLNELTIFVILILVRPYKKFDGQLFLMWMGLYATGRFIIEFYRGDRRGVSVGELSTSQGIAIAVAVTAAVVLFALLSKKKKS
jgi:phosphatidylglycerol:prolipoprotein diacylglycerol transferase